MQSFYFVRHGETDWNKNRVYQGQNDIPLNDNGIRQAQDRAAHIQGFAFDAVYASPLKRARHTADILLNALNENNPALDIVDIPEFMECQSVAAAKFVLDKKGIKDLPSFEQMPDSPETPESFIQRIQDGLDQVFSGRHEMPLIVAHGGVCVGLCEALGTPVIRTPNCCLVKFEYDDHGYKTII
ncbi:MAG: histidine phosphatase family protein [Rhodospirillales bacterium]|nr:histidine phosphatase family protein [Rhodospirillales bacterium]MCB9995247.1 histidine phosphatase family protein [Rhodospirillales bacterium]